MAPSTPTAPYTPYTAGGVPNGLQLGYAFNATIDPSLKTPYNLIFNAGMQRKLPWDMVLKVSYAGRLGRRLLAQTDVNQVLDFPDSTGYVRPDVGRGLCECHPAAQGRRNRNVSHSAAMV